MSSVIFRVSSISIFISKIKVLFCDLVRCQMTVQFIGFSTVECICRPTLCYKKFYTYNPVLCFLNGLL